MMARVGGEPSDFFPRLRAIATAAAPGIIIDELIPLPQMRRDDLASQTFMALVVILIAVLVLALSSAGIYALMFLHRVQHTSEIGIRRALGAQRARVMRQIFAHTLLQLGSGGRRRRPGLDGGERRWAGRPRMEIERNESRTHGAFLRR